MKHWKKRYWRLHAIVTLKIDNEMNENWRVLFFAISQLHYTLMTLYHFVHMNDISWELYGYEFYLHYSTVNNSVFNIIISPSTFCSICLQPTPVSVSAGRRRTYDAVSFKKIDRYSYDYFTMDCCTPKLMVIKSLKVFAAGEFKPCS